MSAQQEREGRKEIVQGKERTVFFIEHKTAFCSFAFLVTGAMRAQDQFCGTKRAELVFVAHLTAVFVLSVEHDQGLGPFKLGHSCA